jgi:hypothetical protein
MLDPGFEWHPHQLLSIIEIIDKLYPEEGGLQATSALKLGRMDLLTLV